MPSFVFIFRAPRTLLESPRTAADTQSSGEKWHAWAEALVLGGHTVTGAQFARGGTSVSGPDRVVSEGAAGAVDVIGGYFQISADSLDEATQLAKGCPMLDHGGTVEVRPVLF